MHEKHHLSRALSRLSPRLAFEMGELVGLSIVVIAAVIIGSIVWVYNVKTLEQIDNTGATVIVPELEQVEQIDPASLRYVKGTGNVTVVLYADLQCPLCKQLYPRVLQLVDDFPNQVRVSMKHHPLPVHERAQEEALAAECIGAQGFFFDYVSSVYNDPNQTTGLTRAELERNAAALGANTTLFKSCIEKETYAQAIKDDRTEAKQTGAIGTPHVIVINNEGLILARIQGVLTQEDLDAIIQQVINTQQPETEESDEQSEE